MYDSEYYLLAHYNIMANAVNCNIFVLFVFIFLGMKTLVFILVLDISAQYQDNCQFILVFFGVLHVATFQNCMNIFPINFPALMSILI